MIPGLQTPKEAILAPAPGHATTPHLPGWRIPCEERGLPGKKEAVGESDANVTVARSVACQRQSTEPIDFSVIPFDRTPRIGIRAHDLGCRPLGELGERLASLGFSHVQLALTKALAGFQKSPGNLSAKFAREVRDSLQKSGVGISVLGCYINPIDPDEARRQAGMEWFKEHLARARDFGCGLVALESGSINPDYSPHPENHGRGSFRTLLESMQELVGEAERHGVAVGLEPVATHPVSTPAKMREVIDSIGSQHLKVVLDPVNLLAKDTVRFQRRLVDEAFDLWGDRIAVVHAKDVVGEEQLRIVPAGQGMIDYHYIITRMGEQPPPLGIILEETTEQTAPAAANHLQQIIASTPTGGPAGRR